MNTNNGNKKVAIVYHANCLDGIASAAICFDSLTRDTEVLFFPCKYGDLVPPELLDATAIYIVDFSFPRDITEALIASTADKGGYCFTLDHHKTAAEALAGVPCCIVDTSGELSGVGVVAEHFSYPLSKLFLRVQDHDLWHFRYPDTKALVQALYHTVFKVRDSLEQVKTVIRISECDSEIDRLIEQGNLMLELKQSRMDRCLHCAHSITLAGIQGLAVNALAEDSSDLGNILAAQCRTFGVTYWYDGPRQVWQYSIRSIGDFDVSSIAKHYGGGGHKNAAGFISLNFI